MDVVWSAFVNSYSSGAKVWLVSMLQLAAADKAVFAV